MWSRIVLSCAALILAAGASQRLGQAKQIVRLGDETLLDRSIRIAEDAGCSPVVVVVGAHEDLVRSQCDLKDALLVFNPDWAQGMSTSISQGVRALEHEPGILLMTCDMPSVTSDHLISLASSGAVTASSYGGRKGVPAYFPRQMFPELLALRGDAGARELLQKAVAIELPGGEMDIDTREDVERARKLHRIALRLIR